MRKVIITILIIVLIILAAPLISGFLFKRNLYHLADTINANPQLETKMSILNYNMGWFKSTTKLQLLIKQFPPIVVDQVITHGPIVTNTITNSKTFAYGNIKSTVSLAQVSNGLVQGDIEMNTLAKPGNKWSYQISMPKMSFVMPDKVNFIVQGVNGHTTYQIKDNQIIYNDLDLKIDAIKFQGTGTGVSSLTLNGFQVLVNGELQNNNYWTGEQSVSLSNLAFTTADGSQGGGQQFKFRSQSVLTSPATSNITTAISLQQLTLPPNNVVTTISPLNYQMDIKNIDVNAFVNLTNSLRNEPTQLTSESIKDYPSRFTALIGQDFNINQQLNLSTPIGGLAVLLDINLPKTNPRSVPELLQDANMTLNLTVAVALVNKVIDEYARIQIAKAQSDAAKMNTPPTTPAVGVAGSPSPQPQNVPTQSAADVPTVVVQPPTPQGDATAEPAAPVATTVTQDATSVAVPNMPALSPEQKVRLKVGMVKQFIDAWIKQGYILLQNDNYVVNLKRVNGVMTINGKSLSLPEISPPRQ